MKKIVDVSHVWTDDNARQLFDAYAGMRQEMERKRASDLGMLNEPADTQTATAIYCQSRRSKMSDEHRAEVFESWQRLIDQVNAKMTNIFMQYTVPHMVIEVKPSHRLPDKEEG